MPRGGGGGGESNGGTLGKKPKTVAFADDCEGNGDGATYDLSLAQQLTPCTVRSRSVGGGFT